jgi:hypothetical protein
MQFVPDYLSSVPFYEKNIDVLFPTKLGKFDLVNIFDNEEQRPGLGVTLEYSSNVSEVQISVYNKSINVIDDGEVSDILINEMDSCIGEFYGMGILGSYEKTSILPSHNITFKVGDKKLSFRCTIANYEIKSVAMTTLIMLCGYKKHFLRIIYTTKKSLFINTPEGEKLYDGFMSSLSNILR